jgi:hypothetical protein
MKRQLGAILGLCALTGTFMSAPQAIAVVSPDIDIEIALFGEVKESINEENQLTLESPAPPLAGKIKSKASAKAVRKLGARHVLKAGVAESNRAAGVAFSTVVTSFVLKEVRDTATGKTLVVDELTRYPTPDGQDYQYRVEHTADFTTSAGSWTLTDIRTDSPTSEVGDQAMSAAGVNPAAAVAAGVARVKKAKSALDRNIGALRAIDDSKNANRRAGLTDDKVAPAADNATPPAAADLARPSERPARLSTASLSAAPGKAIPTAAGDGIQPYEYNAMVTYAKTYASVQAGGYPVGYTRDDNDCTTFVSFALYVGGWKEAGVQDYPSVTWNHDDNDVWYWRCNTCNPVHSYTWGGAINWQRFAYPNRVSSLGYLTDLSSVADVMQLEIDNYGSATLADHTMITTGRNPAGSVLLSYHDDDTLNKPLNQILSAHNGPYWAFRT